MEIAKPSFLLLFLLLPVLYYGHRRSLVDLSPIQRMMSLILRLLLIALLILSLADVQYLKKEHKLAVVFLVDLSDSISEEGLKKARSYIAESMKFHDNQEVGIMVFTDTTRLVKGLTPSTSESVQSETKGEIDLAKIKAQWLNEDEEVGDATNIAQAIEAAWGIFPADKAKRILLITDGVETQGDALRSGLRGKNFGVQIDTSPIYPSVQPEVMVEQIYAPAQVKQGEPFNLEVVVHSNHKDFAEIRLFKNKFEVAKQNVPLKAGENRISFSQTSTESGMLTYDAICRSLKDTLYDNNHALGIVVVSGKPKVLLIDENESQARYLARALEDAEIQVHVRNGLGVPNELSDLQNYDLVTLSDVPATRLNQSQMEFLHTYVQDLGGGLMMLGSENSFGLGGYYKTPIEEILPVRTDPEKRQETPSLAMVLVIDKSGSMEGTKIQLAKEAARATVELLGSRDQIGIIAFDGSPYWIAEMHSASDKMYLSDQIASLRAGGGTNLYPALQQAYSALTETSAKLKHVIVLSDGMSQTGDWYGIVSSMRAERITVSTVGIGSDADMNLLSNIANWGGGRDYFTQDPSNIPQIFAKETVTASKSAIIDEPFIPQVIKPTQVLQGIDLEQAPFLLGYVVTQPKPTAEVFLVSDKGDPVLASWQYGLGKAVAFTSDAKARWAADWLEWPGFGKFWVQLTRDTMRKSITNNFQARINLQKGVARLTIDALNDTGDFLNELESDTSLISPNLKTEQLHIPQTAPGKYELDFPVKEMGTYFVNLLQKQHGEIVNRQALGAVVSYPDEYLVHNANEQLLAQLASTSGGKFKPSPEETFRAPENPVLRRIPLWRFLLPITACLLIVDIALRRIDLRRKFFFILLLLLTVFGSLTDAKGLRCMLTSYGNAQTYAVISGIITDKSGKPIPDVDVRIERDGSQIAQTRTNDSGNYQIIVHSVRGSYDLSATRGAFGDWELGIPLREGERRTLNLKLEEAIRIEGILFMPLPDHTTPHVGILVEAVRGEKVIATRLSDEEGRFEFVNLKPGPYQVRCQIPGGYAYPVDGESIQVERGKTLRIHFHFASFKKGTWKNYNSLDGLADNDIYAIYRDLNGVIWFGTDGGGVSQYDGKSFVNLTTQNGLAGNFVRVIHRDPDGMMWFGTDSGISKYDGKEFVTLTTKDGLVDNDVYTIHRDPDGVLWFGTKGGVSKYDGKKFVNLTTKNGLASNFVRAIYRNPDGMMWLGTDSGVSMYDGKRFINLTATEGIAHNDVYAIYRSPNGMMWFGTHGGGVSKYDGKRFVNFTTQDGLVDNHVHVIYGDFDGRIWFGTDGGVSKYDGKWFVNFTIKDGLANNLVRAIYGDDDGVMWFGTEGGGVSIYDEKGFVNLTAQDGLADNDVHAIYSDTNGLIWFGTAGGVSKYDGREFVNFTTKDGLVNNFVHAIYGDTGGVMWFGTDGGVSIYDGERFVNLTERDGLASNFVYAIYRDPTGVMWFGTHGGGVYRYDGKKFVNFTTKDGLADNRVHAIYGDADGVIWFGTYGGVSIYDGKRFVNLTEGDGLASNVVYAIYRDLTGVKWFGTYGGVSRYDGKGFVNFTIKGGLINNEVNSLYQSPSGVYWFGTDSGVSLYDGIAWTSLDKWEGLVSNTVRTIHQDSDGFVWFGTDGGVTRYRRSIVPPTIRIVSVETDKQYTVLSAIPSILTGTHIAIKYLTIDFKTHLQKRQYRCRIKEIDSDWRSPTKTTLFEWTPPKAGTYTFEVQAIDRALNYSQLASVTFKIVPPFYMRVGFLAPTVSLGTILLVTLILLSIAFVKHRRRGSAYQQVAVQELQDAHKMQMSLMPKTAPPIEGVEIAGRCIPATNTVSGDFFDYLISKRKNEIGIVIADVTGKALKGAMNAVMADGILHAAAREKEKLSPASLMMELNDVLKTRLERNMNVTMIIGVIDVESKTLTLANAGHHALPMLLRDDDIQPLQTEGLPLGVKTGIEYREKQFPLESGDVLIFMTDGIIEAQDSEEQLYSDSGHLEKTIFQFTHNLSAEAMVDAIISDAIDFSGGKATRDDDMTVVVARVQ